MQIQGKKMKHPIRQPMSAIILAGGNSSRMRKEKSLLPVQGAPLIRQVADNLNPFFNEIIISSRDRESFGFMPYRVVHDKETGHGPLMGIMCGLEASGHGVNFVIACDIPEIDREFLEMMMRYTEDYEIVVPVTGDGKYEPLFAFYHRDLIDRIKDLLNRGRRKIIELYSMAKIKLIPMDDNDWYYNLNTETDFQAYMHARKKTPPDKRN